MCACPKCGFNLVDVREDIPNPASKQDVQSLLLSNHPPLQAVESTLRDQYTEAKKYSMDLDTQISRLQSSIETLSQERSKIRGYLEQYRAILHPIRRLPVEVLSCILTLSYSPPDLIKFGGKPDVIDTHHRATRPPLALAQVCRSWRQTATSLPSLWSYVCLDLHPLLNSNSGRNWADMSLLALQMQRTGNHPISLYIQSLSEDNHGVRNHPLLAIMFSTSQRWRTLRLLLSHIGLRVLISVKGSLSSLWELHLDLPALAVDLPIIDVFEFAPALERLVLTGNPNIAIRQIALPWSQLRQFWWSAGAGNERPTIDNKLHLDFLSRMPHLRYCYLEGVRWSSDNIARGPFQLLSLETLILEANAHSSTGHSFEQILDALRAPALQDLRLLGTIEPMGLAGLQNFIRRSGFPLRLLNVRNLRLGSEEIISLLTSLPSSVQTLVLGSKSGLDDSVIQVLHRDSEQTPTLPKLQFFDVRGKKTCSDSVFLDMLESRVKVPPSDDSGTGTEMKSLKTLRLWKPERKGYQVLLVHPRLVQLQNEGLHVVS